MNAAPAPAPAPAPPPVPLAAPAGFPLASLVARANLIRANAQYLNACRDREAKWASSPLFRENSQG